MGDDHLDPAERTTGQQHPAHLVGDVLPSGHAGAVVVSTTAATGSLTARP
jgi:hypothetical protein